MTLKEEFEILRGGPIEVFDGDPLDIPCIETSDSEKLCKHPVVSILMITYNHEPYIRQAIEGVTMQQTDFEFELVIGEDASTDKTREICFEYQKKYPDKIRVLWWHENLRKVKHPAGANSIRTRAHCRGEFIAMCEGDDYWIDPLKLQKQVDVMRMHPEVGMCFCGAKLLHDSEGWLEDWECPAFKSGIIKGKLFALYTIFGASPLEGRKSEGFVMTAGLLIRHSVFKAMSAMYDVFSWRLAIGDTTIVLGCGAMSDIYYLPDQVSVYRLTYSGAMGSNGVNVYLDSAIVRLYFAKKIFGYSLADMPRIFLEQNFRMFFDKVMLLKLSNRINAFRALINLEEFHTLAWGGCFAPMVAAGLIGFVNPLMRKALTAWWMILPKGKLSPKLTKDYKEFGVDI